MIFTLTLALSLKGEGISLGGTGSDLRSSIEELDLLNYDGRRVSSGPQ